MSTELLRNPTNIGDIFFSGSQTVLKGQQVTWILDDTWAFKATEDCGVSTNASPFVNLIAGQTFLIYKRTQADIDAGNTKGIYIFDRDTIVALAYPQEVTQDIIIENDNYNNNINNIDVVVEAADKAPKAIISVNNSKPVAGEVVTVKGTSSYYYAPATSLTYQWHLNGVNKGTGSSFTFTAQDMQYDIDLTVTDNKGLKNDKKMTVYGQAVPTFADVLMSYKWRIQFALLDTAWKRIGTYTATKEGTGTININASISIWSVPTVAKTAYIRVMKGTTQVASGSVSIPANSNREFIAQCISTYTGSVSKTDTFYVELRDPSGSTTKALAHGSSDNQLQIKITNRTS